MPYRAASQFKQGDRQIAVWSRVARIEGDCQSMGRCGLLPAAEITQSRAVVRVSGGQGRVEVDGLPERSQRLFVATYRREAAARL